MSLNWWCEPPHEFENRVYDFTTEIYFIGKLFEKLIQDNEIEHFQYRSLLTDMCHRDSDGRIGSFFDVQKKLQSDTFHELDFTDYDLERYRAFADELQRHISQLEYGAKYVADGRRVEGKLEDVYRKIMLERDTPDSAVITRCFVDGAYYYRKTGFAVSVVRDCLNLLKSSSEAQKRIIFSNLYTRMDVIPRYAGAVTDDDVPF